MISKAEIVRKLIHFFNLVIPLGYMYLIPDRIKMSLIMLITALVFVSVDLARSRIEFIKTFFTSYFGFMMRDHELYGKLTGASWVVAVSVPIIYFFPRDIAILSLVFMSVGDIAAALIGQAIGKIKLGAKTLEGTLGCLITCIAAVYVLDIVPLPVGLTGAVTASLVELLSVDLDDNILIPFGAGTTMILVSSFII